MEKDENRTNLIIVIVLVVFLIGLFIFVAVHHFLSKDSQKLRQEESNEVINPDTSIENSTSYDNYKIGDEVILSDNSSWHVVEDSLEDEEYVRLLKDDPISVDQTNQEVNSYLQNIYLKELIDSLKISNIELQEIHILSLEDVKNITGISNWSIGDNVTFSNREFLCQNSTILKDVDENGNPIFICEEDLDGSIRICTKKEENIVSVRPVISIKKSVLS